MDRQLISTGEAARLAGVSPSTIRLWVLKRELAVATTVQNGMRLFDRAEVERVVASRRERDR